MPSLALSIVRTFARTFALTFVLTFAASLLSPPASSPPFRPVMSLLLSASPALAQSPSSAAAADSAHRDPIYIWPLDIKPELTSTFGEFRPGHFHAGIDVSTFGREGEPVHAVDDGMVVRVRAAPNGYGRAIYLRLRDGRLAVYAHLSDYMAPLADYVADVQERRGIYRVDLYPEAERFPVRRGQVIGRTGSSGAGGPHLHFELREGDIAINPLSHGLTGSDRYPPTLRAIVLTPRDDRARVNDRSIRLRLPLERQRGGYALSEAPTLWGRVSVGIDCYDRAGDRPSRLGPFRAEFRVDGEVVVETSFERFSYHHNHEVMAEFDLAEANRGRNHVLNLFVPPAITGDFHQAWPTGAGILAAGLESGGVPLSPGEHQLTIRIADAAGHESIARFAVRVAAPLELHDAQWVVGAESPALLLDGTPSNRPTRVRLEQGEANGPFTPLGERAVTRYGEPVELDDLLPAARPAWPAALRVALVDADGRVSNRLVVLRPAVTPSARDGKRAAGDDGRSAGGDGGRSAAGDGGRSAAGDGGMSAGPGGRLDPGAYLARLELDWNEPPGVIPRARLADRAVGPLDMSDASHASLLLPATGGSPLTLEWIGSDQLPRRLSLPLDWQAVSRDQAITYWSADRGARVELPQRAFFADAFVWAAPVPRPSAAFDEALPAGLEWLPPLYRIEPADLPLDGRVELALRLPAGTPADAVCLFRFDREGVSWEGSELDGDLVTGRVRRLGLFLLARDLEPPRLAPLVPRDGDPVRSARPLLRVSVDDAESGLDEAELQMRIDDVVVPAEWDPDADVLRYRPRRALSAGRHRLQIQAMDRAGNRSALDLTFSVGP